MEITQEIINSFRASYPEFNCNSSWPDAVLSRALCEADSETGSVCRWGPYQNDCHNFKQRGMFLYAAHWLTATYGNSAINSGNVSAGPKYAVNSKSVGDESITFATTQGISDLKAGDEWLATTAYGQQYMRLRRRAGMGAIAV